MAGRTSEVPAKPSLRCGSIIWTLSALVVIQLAGGCPTECTCNPKMKVVDCQSRGLHDVPHRLQLDTLELYLQHNHICALGPMAFRETPQLRVLNLANNSITAVSANTFQGLRSLLVLNLANNSIQNLDRQLLGTVKTISDLNLSHNSIGSLPATLAGSFHNLTHLSLQYNQLQRLDRMLLEPMTNLQVLLLRGNPWKCNCQLIGLKLWLETFQFRGGTTDKIRCTQPEVLKERDLRNVPYTLFQPCLNTSYSQPLADLHHLAAEHKPPRSHGHRGGAGENEPRCEAKQRARPVNLRYAIATVAIAGVVCGVVCLMMLGAAVYGCTYAAIMARYQQHVTQAERTATPEEHQGMAEGKEPLGAYIS